LDQLLGRRFEPFHQARRLFELAIHREILQVSRLIAGDRGERREHAAELVAGFA
jgi:hypothetical protein